MKKYLDKIDQKSKLIGAGIGIGIAAMVLGYAIAPHGINEEEFNKVNKELESSQSEVNELNEDIKALNRKISNLETKQNDAKAWFELDDESKEKVRAHVEEVKEKERLEEEKKREEQRKQEEAKLEQERKEAESMGMTYNVSDAAATHNLYIEDIYGPYETKATKLPAGKYKVVDVTNPYGGMTSFLVTNGKWDSSIEDVYGFNFMAHEDGSTSIVGDDGVVKTDTITIPEGYYIVIQQERVSFKLTEIKQ